MKAAIVPVPSRRRTVPATRLVPRNSCTEDEVTVDAATGSLNTMTMVVLSGTSRFPDDGDVRTTTGRSLGGTA